MNPYQEIQIPKELNKMVSKTIHKNNSKRKIIMTTLMSVMVLFTFTMSVNISPTFADTLKGIPLIGQLSELLTFKTETYESDHITGTVNMPEVHISQSLDEKINTFLEDKKTEILEEATLRVEEYRTAYLETGGSEEGFKEKNMQVVIDHEIFSQENYLSFRVFSHESLAAVYSKNLYFNIDLNTFEELSLETLLGTDYKTSIYEIVQNHVLDNPEQYFEETVKGDWTVRDDLDFYIKDQALFVVFQKYELAAGVSGRLEFKIKELK